MELVGLLLMAFHFKDILLLVLLLFYMSYTFTITCIRYLTHNVARTVLVF